MASSPNITIVMSSYQQVAYLEEAVRSVLDQEGIDIELLVMDPGSSDGSRELLLAIQETNGDGLALHFEPDRGQFQVSAIILIHMLLNSTAHVNSWSNLHPAFK